MDDDIPSSTVTAAKDIIVLYRSTKAEECRWRDYLFWFCISLLNRSRSGYTKSPANGTYSVSVVHPSTTDRNRYECECVACSGTRPASGAKLLYCGTLLWSSMVLFCCPPLWSSTPYGEIAVSDDITMNGSSMRWSSHQCTGTWYICVFCVFCVFCVLYVLYVLSLSAHLFLLPTLTWRGYYE